MARLIKINHFDKVKLSKIDFKRPKSLGKEELLKQTAIEISRIDDLQVKLYAENRQSLLIIFQALDAGGKDGTIRSVFGPLNPQGCEVTSFKAPNAEELAHDFLWRIHKETPTKGMIKIFNRSHYEDVLIVKVHDWIDDKECRQRYRYINEFERLLFHSGTRILKFFLYISKDEQKKRLEERLKNPAKNWKFNAEDIKERELWDRYIEQFEQTLSATGTRYAPWYVVPANSNKYRNYLIARQIRKTLEKMKPQFPEPAGDLSQFTID